ncbi:MAG: circadian clock KaiB family protein [Thermoguttaceae bacterium]
MDEKQPQDKSETFERLLDAKRQEQFVLRLYVTGLTPRSTQAIDTIKGVCEAELKGRYDLEVIDLAKQPELAREADIVAAPTLIKQLPLPLRRLIGDLSNKERVLLGLDLKPKS